MIPKGRVIACDTETTGISVWRGARPFCFTFCNEEGDTGHFYWKVNPQTREPEIDLDNRREMREFFGNASIVKVFHNSKFDLRMLESVGIRCEGRVEDTYFAAFVLRSNEPRLGLKPLADKYLNFPITDEVDLQKATVKARHIAKKAGWNIAEKGRDGDNPVKADYWLAPKEICLKYAIGDVERTILFWKLFEAELQKDPSCLRTYERELRLQREGTIPMETLGVRIRLNVVRQNIESNNDLMKEKYKKIQTDLKASGYLKPGHEFNPNAPVQVQRLVYQHLKFPVKHFTDSGAPAADAEALAEIDHPLVRVLQEYKAAEKANKNFFFQYMVNAKRDIVNGYDVLHPDFNQVGPKTGRYSCRQPNLQNVANALTTRSPIPIQARTPFTPRIGYIWLCFDYSGQEMWIFADKSQEEKMLSALWEGRDLHAETADFIWGKGIVAAEAKLGKKTARAKAKMLNFGIIFGMGVPACMDFLKCSESEARATLDKYYKAYPRIREFMDEMIKQCREYGYIETAFDRKIWMERDWGYRAVNYYVQGTAADVIKENGMLGVLKYIRQSTADANLLMTIHDEIVLEVRKEDVTPEFINGVKKVMEEIPQLKRIHRIPVEVAAVDFRWDKKTKLSKEDILNVKKNPIVQ